MQTDKPRDDVGRFLAMFSSSSIVLIPFVRDFAETRRRGLIVNQVSVFTGNLKRLRIQIRDVFAEQCPGADVRH